MKRGLWRCCSWRVAAHRRRDVPWLALRQGRPRYDLATTSRDLRIEMLTAEDERAAAAKWGRSDAAMIEKDPAGAGFTVGR